ncbi:MAG: LemA family protein [Nanoarchaeota archaeon]|nr:LemA family protein [Nanoarchaeota archaeon]
MIGLLIGVGAVVIIGGWLIGTYNGLIRIKNEVENAWAQIDVQLKRRFDLIPNLIESVKGYMKHEKDVLENVTKARAAVMSATTVDKKAQASNMLSSTLKSLFAVAENYPKLQANENFMQLQEELTGTENKIAYSRQHYNDSVMMFNTKIQLFPTNMIAGMFNFAKKDMFSAPDEEKQNVKVKF